MEEEALTRMSWSEESELSEDSSECLNICSDEEVEDELEDNLDQHYYREKLNEVHRILRSGGGGGQDEKGGLGDPVHELLRSCFDPEELSRLQESTNPEVASKMRVFAKTQEGIQLNCSMRDMLMGVEKRLVELEQELSERLLEVEGEYGEFGEFGGLGVESLVCPEPAEPPEPVLHHCLQPTDTDSLPLPLITPSLLRFGPRHYFPYFKDRERFSPPDNEDTLAIRKLPGPGHLQFYSSPWTLEEIHRVEAGIGNGQAQKIDWMKISTDLSNTSIRSESECLKLYKLFLEPGLKRGSWSKEEDAALVRLAQEHHRQDWVGIAGGLPQPRSPYQAFLRFSGKFSVNRTSGRWTPAEDYFLTRLVERCTFGPLICWRRVMYYMESRSFDQVYNRWTNSLTPGIVKGRFTREEELAILTAVFRHKMSPKEIAAVLGSRNVAQVRGKLHNQIRPAQVDRIKMGEWSVKEDRRLLDLAQLHRDANYSQLAAAFGSRSRLQVRHRLRLLRAKLAAQPGLDVAGLKRLRRGRGHQERHRHLVSLAASRPRARLPTLSAAVERGPGSGVDHRLADYLMLTSPPLQDTRLLPRRRLPPSTVSFALALAAVLEADWSSSAFPHHAPAEPRVARLYRTQLVAALRAAPRPAASSRSRSRPSLPPCWTTVAGLHAGHASLTRLVKNTSRFGRTELVPPSPSARQALTNFRQRFFQLFFLPAFFDHHQDRFPLPKPNKPNKPNKP